MLHVFIDTNILLRFYSYSNDALHECEKLTALIAAGQIKLVLTEQVVDERARNRDKEVAESLKRLEQIAPSVQMPRFAEHHEAAGKLTSAIATARAERKTLLEAIKSEMEEGGLKADQVIQAMFDASEVLVRTPEIIERARLRCELNNPPGKKESLGDQINWELMLEHVPLGTDLHIISQDGDFKSQVREGFASFFLRGEWNFKKSASLRLYPGLSEFVKEHFPQINVPSDAIKVTAISELVSSGNYSWTHNQISTLSSLFDQLNLEDAILLFKGFIQNSQINDIQSDPDVKDFYGKLYKKFSSAISGELETQLWEAESEDSLFVPF